MVAPLLKVDGIPETRNILRVLGPRSAKNIARRVVVGIAREARDRMRQRVRKRTRTLERAIRHRRRRGKPDFAEAAVFITHGAGAVRDAFYWHFIEFGTSVNPTPQPFIVPTVVEMRAELPGIYLREFGRQLEKEVAKAATKRRAR